MRILCCGDRNWKAKRAVYFGIMYAINNNTKGAVVASDVTIIHGACRGADTLAGEVAIEEGMRILLYPAQWTKYGPAAGPIRNQQMLDEGKPDVVVAYHDDLLTSKGTKDMIERASKAKLPIYVVNSMCEIREYNLIKQPLFPNPNH